MITVLHHYYYGSLLLLGSLFSKIRHSEHFKRFRAYQNANSIFPVPLQHLRGAPLDDLRGTRSDHACLGLRRSVQAPCPRCRMTPACDMRKFAFIMFPFFGLCFRLVCQTLSIYFDFQARAEVIGYLSLTFFSAHLRTMSNYLGDDAKY